MWPAAGVCRDEALAGAGAGAAAVAVSVAVALSAGWIKHREKWCEAGSGLRVSD